MLISFVYVVLEQAAAKIEVISTERSIGSSHKAIVFFGNKQAQSGVTSRPRHFLGIVIGSFLLTVWL